MSAPESIEITSPWLQGKCHEDLWVKLFPFLNILDTWTRIPGGMCSGARPAVEPVNGHGHRGNHRNGSSAPAVEKGTVNEVEGARLYLNL